MNIVNKKGEIKKENNNETYFKSNNIKICDLIDLSNIVEPEEIIELDSQNDDVQWVKVKSSNSCRGCLENQEEYIDYDGCLYMGNNNNNNSNNNNNNKVVSLDSKMSESEIIDDLIYTRVV